MSLIEGFDLGRIYEADSLIFMKGMPSECVDLVFADPPFNLKKKYSHYKDDIPLQAYLHWTEEWIKESIRILKPTGSFLIYNIPKLLTHIAPMLNDLAHFRHWISWRAGGRPLGKTLQPTHYGILFYSKSENFKFYEIRAPHEVCRSCGEFLRDYGGKKHLRHPFGYLVGDVWSDIHRARHGKNRASTHPCQLPVHLVERIILMTTDEGDIVMDPFAGGGSAGVAAKRLGREYLGLDIDEKYCDEGNARIKKAEPIRWRGVPVSIYDVGRAWNTSYLGKVVSVRDKDLHAFYEKEEI